MFDKPVLYQNNIQGPLVSVIISILFNRLYHFENMPNLKMTVKYMFSIRSTY